MASKSHRTRRTLRVSWVLCGLWASLLQWTASDATESGYPVVNITFPGVHVVGTGARRAAVDFEAAVQTALGAVRDTCPDAEPRVAPLVLQDLSTPGHTGPLMFAQCPFVRMNVSRVHARMGPVLVPAALARFLLAKGEATVAWTTPSDAARTAALFQNIEYDVYITVNTAHVYGLKTPDCGGAEGFSPVSVLVHEIVHGLGVFSLLGSTPGGAHLAVRLLSCPSRALSSHVPSLGRGTDLAQGSTATWGSSMHSSRQRRGSARATTAFCWTRNPPPSPPERPWPARACGWAQWRCTTPPCSTRGVRCRTWLPLGA